MYKVLLKKSKNELARLIVLLVALVVVLGLLTATKVFKIENNVLYEGELQTMQRTNAGEGFY